MGLRATCTASASGTTPRRAPAGGARCRSGAAHRAVNGAGAETPDRDLEAARRSQARWHVVRRSHADPTSNSRPPGRRTRAASSKVRPGHESARAHSRKHHVDRRAAGRASPSASHPSAGPPYCGRQQRGGRNIAPRYWQSNAARARSFARAAAQIEQASALGTWLSRSRRSGEISALAAAACRVVAAAVPEGVEAPTAVRPVAHSFLAAPRSSASSRARAAASRAIGTR